MPELVNDTQLQVKQDSARLVPEEGTTGHYLAVTGQAPFEYAFIQPPHDEILTGNADPNGVVYAPKGTLYVERGVPNLWQNTDGGTTWEEVGTSAATGSVKPPGVYGDGSDGAATISGATTLTADMYYTTLVVQSGGTLDMDGYRVFASLSITVDSGGIVSHDGGAAVAQVQGGAAPNKSMGGGTAGANGRTSAGAGANGTSLVTRLGGTGGAGGASGGGNAGGSGGTGGAAIQGGWRHFPATLGVAVSNFGNEILNGGTGGGAGGAESATNSGGGGGGAGALAMLSPTITNNGTIRAQGGVGGNANGANGGGGGGGGGGLVVLTCNTFTGTTPTVAGGAGGTPIGTGVAGSAGTAGRVLVLES